jgi:phospholipid transport system transporter-binding protein
MISCVDGRCTLEGPVTMANVTRVLEESERLFSGSDIIVDLAGVTEVDSAAVSLLLEWRRSARSANRKIQFANIPANVKSLAELYGVSDLLAIA